MVSTRNTSWATEVSEWQQARRDYGLIKDPDGGSSRLEVWRGAPLLPGYVTCVDEREEIVLELARRLRKFVKTREPARHLSILIQADPGTGKTALAKALAKAVGAGFLEFDVTRMSRREELVSIFDAVSALQSNSDKPLVVFVDEINAHIEGAPVFDAFLAPLEGMVYSREGRAFSLRPSAWLFAGTRVVEGSYSASDKFSDFRSRMSKMVEVDYASLIGPKIDEADKPAPWVRHEMEQKHARVEMQAKLEQIYLFATLLLARYPFLTGASFEVIEAIHSLSPSSRPAPSRLVTRLVQDRLEEVHGSVLTRSNCPEWNEVYWSGSTAEVQLVRS